MNKILLSAALLLITACASAPNYPIEKAMVIAYARTVKLNGSPIGPNNCTIYIGRVEVPLVEGQIIQAEVPVGNIQIGRIVCSQGRFARVFNYPLDLLAQVQPGKLNLLAEFDIRLKSPGALESFFVGGHVGTSMKYQPMKPEQVRQFLNANPQLRSLKQNDAIEFEYVRVSR